MCNQAHLHYPTKTLDELLNLPVKDMAKKVCDLFLWACSPFYRERRTHVAMGITIPNEFWKVQFFMIVFFLKSFLIINGNSVNFRRVFPVSSQRVDGLRWAVFVCI